MKTRQGEEKIKCQLVIGADGAFSTVRRSMMIISRMNYTQEFVEWGYKELTIPATDSGDFALARPEGLHIWPRHKFMLIALPNQDQSFTCTLFMAFEGKNGLEALDQSSDEDIIAFFKTNFPDVVEKIPCLTQQVRESPSSPLVTIKCDPWHYKDKIVLIGDAAHAVVPFYGQGMNAGFEDCLLFSEILDKYPGDWNKVLSTFTEQRQPAGVALGELSIQNYREMSSHTANPLRQIKLKIDAFLHRIFPKWIPLYTMVSFTRIPYHIAQNKSRKQDK